VDDRGQMTWTPDDRDVAVLIRSEDRDAQPGHRVQQDRRRVTVVVVETDANDAERGVHRREEVGIGVRGPVVRDLEHVGAQVGTGGQ
jgi:hypothetical protein